MFVKATWLSQGVQCSSPNRLLISLSPNSTGVIPTYLRPPFSHLSPYRIHILLVRNNLFKCRPRRTRQDNLFGVYLEYNHGIYLCKTLATTINQATFIFWHERLPRRCFDNNKSLLFFFRSMRHSNTHTHAHKRGVYSDRGGSDRGTARGKRITDIQIKIISIKQNVVSDRKN